MLCETLFVVMKVYEKLTIKELFLKIQKRIRRDNIKFTAHPCQYIVQPRLLKWCSVFQY